MYGAKIRSLRGLLGMSQEEFCKLAGVNRYTLSNVESDRNTNPTPKFIENIEKALGVSLDDPRIEEFVIITNPSESLTTTTKDNPPPLDSEPLVSKQVPVRRKYQRERMTHEQAISLALLAIDNMLPSGTVVDEDARELAEARKLLTELSTLAA